MMRWGMVPHFAKSLADFKGLATINAKAESLMKNAMWLIPFQRRRCLIPADGFYEWKKLDEKTKQPYASVGRVEEFGTTGGMASKFHHHHNQTKRTDCHGT